MKQSFSFRVFITDVYPLLLVLVLSTKVFGHVRMECPPPLSGATGRKSGPCDVTGDDGSVPSFSLKPNALNTVTWLESIGHPGAPVRFALSGEAEGDSTMGGFETCILLDHVPHDTFSQPTYSDPFTWHRSSITLWIPDIKCERCYLQMISVMSDHVHGVPANTKCVYKMALAEDEKLNIYPPCPAVYHSCSPVSINGTIPRNEIEVCNTTEFEEQLNWPFTPRDTSSTSNFFDNLYNYSVYFNRGDVGLYSSDARLLSVGMPLTDARCTDYNYCDPQTSFVEILEIPDDAKYTSLEGSCAPMVTSEVEPYQLGGCLSAIQNCNANASLENVATVSSSGVSILSLSIIHTTTAVVALLMSPFLL